MKNEVFSKSDQCLNINDPIEYILDSIQDESKPLNIDQINFLYRFKPEKVSEMGTKKLLNNSFYAFKAVKENREDSFIAQVDKLILRRNQLDKLSESIDWIKEISYKTGVDPTLIQDLSNAIDDENVMNIVNFSISQYIDWFFNWLPVKVTYLNSIFTKPSTINEFRRAIGLKQNQEDIKIF